MAGFPSRPTLPVFWKCSCIVYGGPTRITLSMEGMSTPIPMAMVANITVLMRLMWLILLESALSLPLFVVHEIGQKACFQAMHARCTLMLSITQKSLEVLKSKTKPL